MAKIITANELKTKGISVFSDSTGEEVIITIRGKSKYVVLPIEKYNYFREFELENALAETRKDIKEGKFKKESIENHIKRLKK